MLFVTLYFLVNWIPKLVVATGLSMELAIYVGTVFNLGLFFGMFSGSIVILIGLIGLANQGGYVGLYSIAARLYATEIRTTGIG